MSANGRLKDAQHILQLVLDQLEQANVTLSQSEQMTLSSQLRHLLQTPIPQLQTEADSLAFANGFINVVREVSAFAKQLPPLPDHLLRWRGVPAPDVSVPATPERVQQWQAEATRLTALGELLLSRLSEGEHHGNP